MMKLEYDDAYPNLCSGRLIIYIDDTRYDFGYDCLSPDGDVDFGEDGSEIVTEGPWNIKSDSIPSNFPKDRLSELMNLINDEIERGCCGGCV